MALRYVILHFGEDFLKNNICNISSVYTELQGKAHSQDFANLRGLITAIYYKRSVTHYNTYLGFLPNNVAAFTVPNIPFLYQCHFHWIVFSFHSKLQLLAQTRCPLRKTNTVFWQS